MQRLDLDEKNNYVNVTLFESYLSLFIVEHPEFYKDIYFKLLDVIENFITHNRKSRTAAQCLNSIFYDINSCWPGCDSFANLKTNFSLPAADKFIKLCA